jgi:hypothetical protein
MIVGAIANLDVVVVQEAGRDLSGCGMNRGDTLLTPSVSVLPDDAGKRNVSYGSFLVDRVSCSLCEAYHLTRTRSAAADGSERDLE